MKLVSWKMLRLWGGGGGGVIDVCGRGKTLGVVFENVCSAPFSAEDRRRVLIDACGFDFRRLPCAVKLYLCCSRAAAVKRSQQPPSSSSPPPPPLLPRNTIGDMDLAFYLPCLHERMPLAGQPPVRGRGAADAGHALGSSGGAPGDMSVVYGRLCPLLAVG